MCLIFAHSYKHIAKVLVQKVSLLLRNYKLQSLSNNTTLIINRVIARLIFFEEFFFVNFGAKCAFSRHPSFFGEWREAVSFGAHACVSFTPRPFYYKILTTFISLHYNYEMAAKSSLLLLFASLFLLADCATSTF